MEEAKGPGLITKESHKELAKIESYGTNNSQNTGTEPTTLNDYRKDRFNAEVIARQPPLCSEGQTKISCW